MQITLGSVSARLLLSAVALSGATLLVAVGCGGGSSSSGGPGGTGGSTGATGGGTSSGGTSSGGTHTGATGGTDTGGSTTGGGMGEAGADGGTMLPPAQNHSALAFVAGGITSKSVHWELVGNIGENLGGTGITAKSPKHQFIPGVVAAATP
jgi:hypothetical protein